MRGLRNPNELLQLYFGAGGLKLRLYLFGFGLAGSFLDRVRRTVHNFLGLLKAEAGNATDLLDDSNLVAANGRENDVEFGLLLCLGSAVATDWASNSYGSSSRLYTVLFFQEGSKLVGLLDGEVHELFCEFGDLSHDWVMFLRQSLRVRARSGLSALCRCYG